MSTSAWNPLWDSNDDTVVITALSCTLETDPIFILFLSPRKIAPYQIDTSFNNNTSPITEAFGATKTSAAIRGLYNKYKYKYK